MDLLDRRTRTVATGAPPELVVGIILAVAIAVRLLVILGYPVGFDQGVFAWLGQVVVEGGRPYVDAWDTKGPGVFAVGASLALLGKSGSAHRVFDVLLHCLAAGTLVLSAASNGHRRLCWIAAAAYLGAYATFGFHESAQPDSWADALLVIGFAPSIALLRPDGQRRPLVDTVARLFLAGAVVSATGLLKPTYALLGAVPLLVAWLVPIEGGSDRRGIIALALCAGFAFPLALCGTWLWVNGALVEAYSVVVKWNTSIYAGGEPGGPGVVRRFYYGFMGGLPWWPIVPAAGFTLLARRFSASTIVAVLWTVLATLEIVVQRKFWGYHYAPLIGAVATLVSTGGAERTSPSAQLQSLMRLTPLITLFVSLLIVVQAIRGEWDRVLYAFGMADRASMPTAYRERMDGLDSVASFIRAASPIDSPVLFWGTLAYGHVLAERRAVGRFALSRPLLDGEGSPFRASYRAEFWNNWERRPPAVVVTYSNDHCERTQNIRWTCLSRYPELSVVVNREYTKATTIGVFDVFTPRRTNESTPLP